MNDNGFPALLCRELDRRKVHYKAKLVDGADTGEWVFAFHNGVSLKARLAKTDNMLLPQNQDRDEWEWCREAGRAIEAAERFIHGQAYDIFSKPPKRSYERIDYDLERRRTLSAGLPPIEIGMDAALRRSRAKPQKSRELNSDGSMRQTVYRFRKGAVMRLYEDGRCCWGGAIPAICDAVMAADRAYDLNPSTMAQW